MQRDSHRSTDEVKSLAERLAAIPSIASLSTATQNEPWTLADSLLDIAGASETYLGRLPKLLNPEVQGVDLMQLLLELTSELEHMLYHLEEPRFLRQLFEPLRDDWEKQRSE